MRVNGANGAPFARRTRDKYLPAVAGVRYQSFALPSPPSFAPWPLPLRRAYYNIRVSIRIFRLIDIAVNTERGV